MPFKILVIDDNIRDSTDTISGLPALLEREGYEVATTAGGETAYDLVFEYKPDLIVLDIHFGRQSIDGIKICRAIRTESYQAPIILITAVFTETEDVVAGFEAGADDYVRKPCDNLEILARIRANLPPGIEEFDDRIRMDFENQRVCVKRNEEWQEVNLQPLLSRLLQVLVLNAGRIVESTRLKDRVWDKDDISDDALAVCIRRLREKLELDPHHPMYVETIRGVGYRFNGRPTRARRGMPQRRKTC
jgi:two-component system, OmpR family, response regulator MtrA